VVEEITAVITMAAGVAGEAIDTIIIWATAAVMAEAADIRKDKGEGGEAVAAEAEEEAEVGVDEVVALGVTAVTATAESATPTATMSRLMPP